MFTPPYIYVGLFEEENVQEDFTPTRRWFREQTKNQSHNVETCMVFECITCKHYLNDLVRRYSPYASKMETGSTRYGGR